jgi:predicted aminopeptidase
VEIIASLTESYKQLSTRKWDGKSYYEGWFTDPPNNAKLALYSTYEGSNCPFQGLLDEAGGDLERFHRLAEQKAGLKNAERKLWLHHSCGASATPGNP